MALWGTVVQIMVLHLRGGSSGPATGLCVPRACSHASGRSLGLAAGTTGAEGQEGRDFDTQAIHGIRLGTQQTRAGGWIGRAAPRRRARAAGGVWGFV
ncbi:MAG: hypothetical protein J3K34DRAFT_420848 [Monoraphidium minutum]|nr:MAG: hypothetical protein J3K34DRAFT_420848 [Monoraphidium minutum]